jgi:hypothetical protein
MQTIHRADDRRADARTYGNSWVFPEKSRVKPSSVMQEDQIHGVCLNTMNCSPKSLVCQVYSYHTLISSTINSPLRDGHSGTFDFRHQG